MRGFNSASPQRVCYNYALPQLRSHTDCKVHANYNAPYERECSTSSAQAVYKPTQKRYRVTETSSENTDHEQKSVATASWMLDLIYYRLCLSSFFQEANE